MKTFKKFLILFVIAVNVFMLCKALQTMAKYEQTFNTVRGL